MIFEAVKTVDESFALNNTICVSSRDFPDATSDRKICAFVKPILNGQFSGQEFLFTIIATNKISAGQVGFASHQRKWCRLGIGQQIEMNISNVKHECIFASIELNFLKSSDGTKYGDQSFSSDQMALKFNQQFNSQVFSKSQPFIFDFNNVKFSCLIKSLKSYNLSNEFKKSKMPEQIEVESCLLGGNTVLAFEASETSPLMLSGKSRNLKANQNMIINPDFDFASMGIGGLGDEFQEIFRRAFASRIFPPDIVTKMGGKHVKGILLHGPPGCGKTLMARKIGKMLSAREPQVVNGPEILNKYVGESEANVRKLFEPAEEEQKRLGKKSGLHIIIFDEIDAICKQRGSSASSGSQVGDTVVNQLLSKIDGVDQLDNILIIGMTNRPDLIDDALVRPGRLEVKKEIALPDEKGRLEIIKIHTKIMRSNGMLSDDVNLEALAERTKNFSGAEIEGLVRAAQSYNFTRHTKAGSKVEVDYDNLKSMQVNYADFQNALDNDIKPAFGAQEAAYEQFIQGDILKWGTPVIELMNEVGLLVDQVKNSPRTPFVTCLLEGVTGAGKTALAAQLAKDAQFPFVKFCAPKDFIGYGESAKCNKIAKIFEDAHKTMQSIIVIDDIERLLEYNPIGPRFSNSVAQTLMVLLKKTPPKGKRLLILATSSSRMVMEQMGLIDSFDSVIRCPPIKSVDDLSKALTLMKSFDENSRKTIIRQLKEYSSCYAPIKKLIHEVGAIEQVVENDRVAKFLCSLEDKFSLK